ncbi:MAG: hypothetical protein MUE42_05150, partial [Opitutaceae bacterium]|nr:hypothetical protein [Opitutaceae bacterium]
MRIPSILRTVLAFITLGLFASGAQAASAVISDFHGSYEARLVALESATPGGPTYTAFYGRMELTVTASKTANTAAVSGTLLTRAGKKYPFKTTVALGTGGSTADQRNVGLVPLRGAAGVFLVNFSLSIDTAGVVTVRGENFNPGDANAIFFSENSLRFATFTGKGESIPAWLGNYTLAFINPSPSGATVPAGAGFATLSVAKTGVLTYKGKTGDGAIITGNAKPTASGNYGFFATPAGYAVGGYISGIINLATPGLQEEPAVWNKVAKTADKTYSAGFSTVVDVLVRPWFVPSKGAYPFPAALGLGSSKNFQVTFSPTGLSDGDYSANLPTTLRITQLGVIQAVSGGAGSPPANVTKPWNALWNVKLNPLTGAFSGMQVLTHLNGTKTVTRKAPVEGVMMVADALSSEPFAYGQYLVTPKAAGSKQVSGLVTFVGPLQENVSVATAGNYTVKVRVDLAEMVGTT